MLYCTEALYRVELHGNNDNLMMLLRMVHGERTQLMANVIAKEIVEMTVWKMPMPILCGSRQLTRDT